MERVNTLGQEMVGGVTVYPVPITPGEHINIIYNGLLARSGATEIWLHLGYGHAHNWEKVQDLKMFKTGRGWEQTLKVPDEERLHFCFKDSANNWDNNNGRNWSYEIHNGRRV